MIILVTVIFLLGYLFIVLEHPLKLDKTVPTLLMSVLLWTVVSMGFYYGKIDIIDIEEKIIHANAIDHEKFSQILIFQLGKTSEILFFLLGAMTIVELIDLHAGFEVFKRLIKTKKKIYLLWILSFLAFFLSSIIDNMTAAIIMVTIIRKIIPDKSLRIWFAAFMIIPANAGGAWSPIGDVTTTMLWIANKTSSLNLILELFLPSVFSLIVPLIILSFNPNFKGTIEFQEDTSVEKEMKSSKIMLILGLGMILFVPFFKYITHLPPYLGMLFSLAIIWLVSEFIHPSEDFDQSDRHLFSGLRALSRIELSSVLFFLGILMALGCFEIISIEGIGALKYAAIKLTKIIPQHNIVICILGLMSAILDNVPLVAATIGMFDFPIDSPYWHLIAYAAGTGGSILIIGSAAGVAVMGMEKINFIWYFKRLSPLALLSYFSGFIVFLAWSYLINNV